MRVKMLAGITGTIDGQDWPPVGGVIDLSASEAEHLIAGGLAEAAEGGAVESATVDAPEDATLAVTADKPKPARRSRAKSD